METDTRRKRSKGIMLPGLKRARERKGYSLGDLAERSGVDASMISKLENQARGAQGRTVRKLAGALGVDTEDLVG
jgi:transcriptional regulator with XRE-family HTH domain